MQYPRPNSDRKQMSNIMALEEIRKARLKKLENIKRAGLDPYPAQTFRSHEIQQVLADFDSLAEKKEEVKIAGRVMAFREHGGSAFADIADGSGQMQALFKKDVLGDQHYDFVLNNLDIGDFIEAGGIAFKTKRGESTIEVSKFGFLAKSLLPLPEKWHGFQDVEDRYRKRYLDLIFNPEVREKFLLRSKIIEAIRRLFIDSGFMEVETPVLQTIPGGATAKPFKTYLNTLDLDLYLRVAPELYLKRLLVGGFEKVFEIARNFRNEGMDREHNPEFTMLEAYAAYKDYNWMMEFTENLLANLCKAVFGDTKIKSGDDVINFAPPYKRIKFNDLLKAYLGIDYSQVSEKDLVKKAGEERIEVNKMMTKGNLADELFKKVIRPKIIDPVFVTDHPLEISPLSKKLEPEGKYVARFQLVVGGMEVCNAFSELNDPLDQRERFKAQEKLRKKGDEEAQRLDEDFLEALEYGMPPAAGIGIGIDRIIALLTDSHSIREILLFPLMKPR